MRQAAVVLAALVISSQSTALPPGTGAGVRVELTKEQVSSQCASLNGKPIALAIYSLGPPAKVTNFKGTWLHYHSSYGDYMIEVRDGKVAGFRWAEVIDPNARMTFLLNECEDLKAIREERRKFWMSNQPSTLSYDRLNGAIGP